MNGLWRDVRYGARRLLSTPGFTLIAILSLALGIGANTAIFSLVNAILLRRPPIAAPEQVVELHVVTPDYPYMPFSFPDLRDLEQATTGVITAFAAAQLANVPLDLGGSTQKVATEIVTGAYFEALGLHAARGRLLTTEDDRHRGAHPVVVLSHAAWQARFGGDPAIIGREVRLNGRPFTIVGVAPRDYLGYIRGLAPEFYAPRSMMNQLQPATSDLLEARGNHGVFVRARLAPGTTAARLGTALAAYTADMQRQYQGEWPGGSRVVATPLAEVRVNPMLDRVLAPAGVLLLVVVALVLLIACANLASFLLARARDRQREIAIRLALGAGRIDLMRQLLTESLVLAGAGGAAGVLLAKGLLSWLAHADLPLPLPVTLDLGLDPIVLGYALAAALTAGVLFGLAPALQATRADVVSTIKSENTGGGPPTRFGMRDLLVVGQVAGSLVLLMTAGLFLRSFAARQAVDPGFGSAPSALLTFALPSDRYDPVQKRAFIERLEERVLALPGVVSVGVIGNLHLNTLSNQSVSINVDGIAPPDGQVGFNVDHTVADAGFFDAAGIPLLAGRTFGRNDVAGGERVAVVNRAMADRFWPGRDAVGQSYRHDGEVTRVVGVVATAKIRTLGEADRPFIYSPISQNVNTFYTLLVQVRGDPARAAPGLLAIGRSLDPDLVLEAGTLDRHLATGLLPAQLGALAFLAFATLAVLLAVVGIYGIVSYSVSRRIREVGIRLSLGATAGGVVSLMMRAGLKLVVIGVGIGMALSLAGARVLARFLYGVEAADPLTLAVVPALIVAVGAAAALVPALRASRVKPARVLTVE